jgi:hypothetical protein
MMSGMRILAGRIALVLAGVLLPLAMLSAWSSAILSDNDKYVDAVRPLAGNADVQAAVTDQLSAAAVTLIDQSPTAGPCDEPTGGELGSSLDGLGDLARAVMPLAEGPIRSIVGGIVQGPRFARAWVAGNRAAHDQLIGVLKGDDSRVDDTGCVSIDLSAVLHEAVPALNSLADLGISLPDAKAPVASISAGDLHAARVGYTILNPLGFWLPALWIIAVLAAFLLRPRRVQTVWILGGRGLRLDPSRRRTGPGRFGSCGPRRGRRVGDSTTSKPGRSVASTHARAPGI